MSNQNPTSQGPYFSVANPLQLSTESQVFSHLDDSPFTPGNILESHLSNHASADIAAEEEEVLIIDKDDEENFKVLTNWLLKKAEIIPSLTRKYGQIFLNEGVGSVSRLHKRVKKDHGFLSRVGIKEDDIEEIVLALNRQEVLLSKQQQFSSPSKELPSSNVTSSYHGGGAQGNLNKSNNAEILDLTSSAANRSVSVRADSLYVSTHGSQSNVTDAEAQANVLQVLTEIASARARERSSSSASVLSAGEENSLLGPNSSYNPFSESGVPNQASSFDELAKSGNCEEVAVIPVLSPAELEVIQKLKRFKQSTYVRPASPEAIAEAQTSIANLKTAIETKMEAAVIGVLNSMNISMSNSANGEANRAYFKAEVSVVVVDALIQFNESQSICEKAMQTCALLCRYSDENKSSVCLENAKALGTNGAADAIAAALLKHVNDNRVLMAACDAIRCMCLLDSNRVRFGNAAVCETVARALGMKRFMDNVEICCWICRALGHLASSNDQNRERLGNVGACETIIGAIQFHQTNSSVCTEACWALRHIAPIERNRTRIGDEFGPENLISVFKTFYKDPIFVVEAVKALVAFILDESDELIARMVNAGIVQLVVKSMKKNLDEEDLCAWCWNLFYFVSCDAKMRTKLSTSDILNVLSLAIEAHAGNEKMAEWGCRTVHNLVAVEGVTTIMKNAGLCEMVVSCVQRQAISPSVCGYGCLAIGDLAMDKNNHSRLSDSGACEAVVGSLKRHDDNANVVFQTCHAIHYLTMTDNNVAWIGANGGCDALTIALMKHTSTSVTATRSCLRALGSLGRDEGNMARLHGAGACAALVTALKMHGMDPFTAEYGFRAIYNICTDNANVSELGSKGACGLVAAGLQRHVGSPAVVTQACFAVYALAVKMKNDRVHQGNTRKLVTKGAIESVILIMKKYPREVELTRAGALALSSLARVDINREKLGAEGAVEVVLLSFKHHAKSEGVLTALAIATDRLCQDSSANKIKFMQGDIIDLILTTMNEHEKCAALMGECLRALVTFTTISPYPPKLKHEESLKLFIRVMKLHEKYDKVARWGCNVIYTCASDETSREKLGNLKACDAVNSALRHHSASDGAVTTWACKSLVALSMYDVNKQRFINTETCMCVIKALQSHQEDAVACEWTCAAIVSLAMSESNRIKLGAAGACAALCSVLTKQMASSEIVTKLACEAIYEMSFDESNRHLFAIVGACELIVNTLNTHISHVQTAQHVCRAIAGLAKVSFHNTQNPDLLGAAGACEAVAKAIKTHIFSSPLVEAGCAAIAALCHDAHERNQKAFFSLIFSDDWNMINTTLNAPTSSGGFGGFAQSQNNLSGIQESPRKGLGIASAVSSVLGLGTVDKPTAPPVSANNQVANRPTFKDAAAAAAAKAAGSDSSTQQTPSEKAEAEELNIFKLLTQVLITHRSNHLICALACRAARTLSTNNYLIQREFSQVGLLPAVLKILKLHKNIDPVVEHSCWLLTNIIAPLKEPAAKEEEVRVVKDLIDLDMNNIPPEAVPAPSKADNVSTAHLAIMPNSIELYKMPSNWDILLSVLQVNYQKQILARHICSAVSVFADRGQLENLSLCDTVLTTLTRHMDKELVLMNALMAVGKLSLFNKENKMRLIRGQALETIDRILTTFTEGESISRGVFAALAGLASDSPQVQAKISTFTNMCKSLVKFLYAELESEDVSYSGCEAIANIVYKNKINQGKLSGVCNYMADVLEAHYKNPMIAREACRAISTLSHCNITNRNKLGACDACTFVPKALLHHAETDNSIVVWAVRAIADLAANNPNNQTKLGSNGACQGLVQVLRSLLVNSTVQSIDTMDEVTRSANINLAKWTLWAVGNVIQLGRGSGFMIDDSKKSSSMTARTQKNTTHLAEAGAAEIVVKILIQYGEYDGEVAKWAARAINNLAKSRSLKQQLIQNDALDVLSNLLNSKYKVASGRVMNTSVDNLTSLGSPTYNMKEQSVGQWISSAIDALQSQGTMTGRELDREGSSTPGIGDRDSNIAIKSITGSSNSIWNDIESSAGATAKAVFGVAPTMRRKSSEQS